jgi:enoyl-CoA hydratase
MLKWDFRVSLGVIPGYGGTQRLPQLIGKGRAMEMIMTAGMVSADDAYRTGLVNHVVPQTALLEFCNGIAQKIMKNSPVAITQTINAVNANFKDGENGYETEIKSLENALVQRFQRRNYRLLEKKSSLSGE